MGWNAITQFKLNEAVSMFIICEDPAEVDCSWNVLTAILPY